MAQSDQQSDTRLENPEYQKMDPDRVQVESRLVDGSNPTQDSKYEIDLYIDDIKVATTYEYGKWAREKIYYLNETLINAKADRKYLKIDTVLFHPYVYQAFQISEEFLPSQTEKKVACEGTLDGGALNSKLMRMFEGFLQIRF